MKKVVAFGEILLRLSPAGNDRIIGANRFEACYGGTESNVLVALSGLGHDTEYISVVPDNAFGTAVSQHLRKYNVGTTRLLKRGEVLGTYYLEKGFGNRATSVVYNRRNSEITRVDKNLFSDADYDDIFASCGIFHISGISFGLSEGCRALAWRMMDEAQKRGIPVSFDCNYRAKVWGAYPAEEYKKILSRAEIIFCSQKDLDAMEIHDITPLFTEGRCRYLVKREKETPGFDTIEASCSTFLREESEIREYVGGRVRFRVLEKIGGGDVFDAAMLHYLSEDAPDILRAMEFALGCYELKHTICEDVMHVSEKEAWDFIKNKEGKGLSR